MLKYNFRAHKHNLIANLYNKIKDEVVSSK